MSKAPTSSTPGAAKGHWSDAPGSRRGRFVALALFMALVLLTGGGSRFDLASLVVLRPLAILTIAYAVTRGSWRRMAPLKAPLFLLAGLMILVATQLIPLPPAVWAGLPGRAVFVQAAEVGGVGQAWQPITLSAARTLNSLFALSVPLAALLLTGLQSRRDEEPAIRLVAALGLASAVWGVFQLLAPGSLLYLYAITNDGPVGFFANRNHQAVFLAAVVPFMVHIALAARSQERSYAVPALALGGAALMVLVALVTGSRAGLLSLVLSFGISALMIRGRWAAGPDERRRAAKTRYAVMAGLAGLAAIAAVLFLFGHGLAFERLYETSAVDEGRFQVLPTLLRMTFDLFPSGAGFGSFDLVYYHYETLGDLSRYYLNHAHDDWLEVLIEGGVMAGVLLVLALIWLIRRAVALLRQPERGARWSRQLACLGFILIIGFASLVDYPARTPTIAAVLALAAGLVAASQGREDGEKDAASSSARSAG